MEQPVPIEDPFVGEAYMEESSTGSPKIIDFFPLLQIWPLQKRVIEFIQRSVDEGKKFIAIEAPTGTGKTGIAMAVAKWAASVTYNPNESYILTSTKLLQAQYMRDFEHMGMCEMFGRSNYTCDRHKTNCEAGGLMGDDCTACPYKAAKNKFVNSPLGVANYHYFLYETENAHQLPRRRVLIMDEGHNVEDIILSYANADIPKAAIIRLGIEKIPDFSVGQNKKVAEWIKTIFLPVVSAHLAALTTTDKEHLDKSTLKEIQALTHLKTKVAMFLNEGNLNRDWVAFTDDTKISIRPLVAAPFFDLFFSKADIVIFLSATLPSFDTFFRSLGIVDSYASLRVDSPFPAENRRMYYKPVGRMGMKDKDKTMPRMLATIEGILRKFPSVKGIVHTHSYAINNTVVAYLRATDQASRIITHTSEPGARERALEKHIAMVGAPTILFSPAMAEGVDLADDLSRLQVICKIPYPSLDVYTKARMERNPDWYACRTVTTLVQMTGRSNRNINDKSCTIILDGNFSDLLHRHGDMFPVWWMNALVT